ncbi:MAG: DUF3108 domain-containing protein [Reyranellaceae bacterium]
MSFRNAIRGLSVALLMPLAAAAQDARPQAMAPAPAKAGNRQVEIAYEITYAGMAGFRIDVTARFAGDRYDVETSTYKNGVLKAVTMNYAGRNRAWGGFAGDGTPRPAGGSLALAIGDKTRTWAAQYGPDGSVQEAHVPEWKPLPTQVIPERDRIGSLDPLSAALTAGLAGDAACDRTLPTNDGKRRVDVILRSLRRESAAQSGIAGAQGDVLVCELSTRRVSGEFHDMAKESEAERERPVRLWFARLDDSPFRYPARLEVDTGWGTARGRMLWFRERPLAAEEAQSLRR